MVAPPPTHTHTHAVCVCESKQTLLTSRQKCLHVGRNAVENHKLDPNFGWQKIHQGELSRILIYGGLKILFVIEMNGAETFQSHSWKGCSRVPSH